jgi:DNA polymerase I-like protein with 3'-5' exonuclease and polymerase domains
LAYSGFALSNVFQSDVARAFRFARGESLLCERTVDSSPTEATIRGTIREIIERGEGGLDIETPEPEDISEDDRSSSGYLPVSVIGLSSRTDSAIAVHRDRFSLLAPLFNLASREHGLEHKRPILWAFNSSFDFYHLEQDFKLDGVTEACAMTLFHMLQPDSTRKDLGTMMSLYTDLPFHKYLQDIDPDLYNASDTWGVLAGAQQMMRAVRQLDLTARVKFPWVHKTLESLFWDFMMPAVKIVRRWEYEGAAYDQEASDNMMLQAMEVLSHYEEWWLKNVPDYSWASPKQLIELFTVLGAHVPKRKRKNPKTKQITFTPSVDDEALNGLSAVGGVIAETAKLVQLMRGYKKASDFTGLGTNNRVYCRAKVHGQVGGRIQTIKQNMQQIPERCPEFDLEVHPEFASAPFIEPRNCVIPDERGMDVVISADFSQIEFWLYSWYSKCKRALEIKESGDYLYGSFYEDIWKEPFFYPVGGRSKGNRNKAVPPWKLLVAKSWPLGFTYGRGVPHPEDQGLPITQRDAARIHAQFHKDYPEFGVFHRELEFLVNRQGYLQTAFGRLRHFPNPKGQRNEYLAFPGQTTAVDVLLRNALIPLSTLLPTNFGGRSRVLFTVHDSVICNVTCNRSLRSCEEAYHLVKQTLEAPILELDGFSIPCEVKVGPSWGQGMSWPEFERWAVADGAYTQ